MYKIIKNSPRVFRSIYPFDEMEINDCFEFEKEKQNRVSASAHAYFKSTGKRFMVRKVSSTHARCWRIS